MADQGKNEGPILTPMQDIPGNPKDLRVGEGVFGGEPGWPAESAGKIPTLIYEKTGQFGDVKKAE